MVFKRFAFGLLLLVAVSSNAFAQSLNNEYAPDQEDYQNAFDLLGVEIYKFPVKTRLDSAYTNVIIERYVDGELAESKNLYQDMKPTLAMLDEPLNEIIQPMDEQERWLRFYFHEEDTTLALRTVNGSTTTTVPISLDGYSLTGSRAFDDIPAYFTERKRLLTFYANREGNMISCPAGATPEQIASLYDLAVIVYAKPVQPSAQ